MSKFSTRSDCYKGTLMIPLPEFALYKIKNLSMEGVKVIYKKPDEDSEYRCFQCNRLLLKGNIKDGVVNIKCPRCKNFLQILEVGEGHCLTNADLDKILNGLKTTFDHSSEHIVITDKEGIIFYANRAAELITGFKIEEMIGQKSGNKDLWGGLMDNAYYKELWETIYVRKKNFISEIKNKKKDGTQYDSTISISPILNKEDEILSFVALERPIGEDLDELRKRVEEITESIKKAITKGELRD